ncbi:MAG: hypothetical protein ABFD24_01740 [Anaerolineaceae bacterium]
MKKVLFYAGLVVLPFIGYELDLWEYSQRTQLGQTFNPFPMTLWVILTELLFAALLFWLARQTPGLRMPVALAAIVMVLGLAVVCIPLLFPVSLTPSATFFVTWLPVHRSIAGAFLFITGLAALIWNPKSAST